MIPGPWEFALLALAAYRLTRLGGWDDWPPIYRVRAWVIGERWILDGEVVAGAERDFAYAGSASGTDLELPGKQPTSEASGVRPAYDRPTLAHLLHCPFCLGWWVSLCVYATWLVFPTAALYVAVPFALSGAVGLLAKNLDA